MNIEMHQAKLEEVKLCMKFIDEAREYQMEQGFIQWTKEYPNMDTIIEDINKERGYTFTLDGIPFGYACIDCTGEPAYEHIDGEWINSQSYIVIHRMAFGKQGRGKGAAKSALALIKKLCITKDVHSIRVDTDVNNKGMQHILKQEGYLYCGVIMFQGSSKLAYQLLF